MFEDFLVAYLLLHRCQAPNVSNISVEFRRTRWRKGNNWGQRGNWSLKNTSVNNLARYKNCKVLFRNLKVKYILKKSNFVYPYQGFSTGTTFCAIINIVTLFLQGDRGRDLRLGAVAAGSVGGGRLQDQAGWQVAPGPPTPLPPYTTRIPGIHLHFLYIYVDVYWTCEYLSVAGEAVVLFTWWSFCCV